MLLFATESGTRGEVERIVRRLVGGRLLRRDDHNTLRVVDPSKLLDAWAGDYEFMRHTLRAGLLTATSGHMLEAHARLATSGARIGPRHAARC